MFIILEMHACFDSEIQAVADMYGKPGLRWPTGDPSARSIKSVLDCCVCTGWAAIRLTRRDKVIRRVPLHPGYPISTMPSPVLPSLSGCLQ
jgi:hypothetical protein